LVVCYAPSKAVQYVQYLTLTLIKTCLTFKLAFDIQGGGGVGSSFFKVYKVGSLLKLLE